MVLLICIPAFPGIAWLFDLPALQFCFNHHH